VKYVVSFFDRGLRTPGSGTNLLQKKQQKEEGRDLSFASYTEADVGVYVQHHDLEDALREDNRILSIHNADLERQMEDEKSAKIKLQHQLHNTQEDLEDTRRQGDALREDNRILSTHNADLERQIEDERSAKMKAV
jgi:hypothetical protein